MNNFFTYSCSGGHWGCVSPLAIMKITALNIGEQISIHVLTFNSFGFRPNSEINGTYKNPIFNVQFQEDNDFY